MNAYIYNAALYCEPCANQAMRILNRDRIMAGGDLQGMNDSDTYPQGPYTDGGGESDTPAHCDNCGVFLENPLTTDGVEYVRELIAEAKADALDGRNGVDNENALQYWTTFYADVLA